LRKQPEITICEGHRYPISKIPLFFKDVCEPWWGCGFIFFWGGFPNNDTGIGNVAKVLLCSLFDLLWEVLGAEKVLRRDVEEEEGPVTGIETKVVEASKSPSLKICSFGN